MNIQEKNNKLVWEANLKAFKQTMDSIDKGMKLLIEAGDRFNNNTNKENTMNREELMRLLEE